MQPVLLSLRLASRIAVARARHKSTPKSRQDAESLEAKHKRLRSRWVQEEPEPIETYLDNVFFSFLRLGVFLNLILSI